MGRRTACCLLLISLLSLITPILSEPAQTACGIQDPRYTPRRFKRIVGGRQARPHSWPWQVGIYKDGRYRCGGSLISQTYVLTAASCIRGATPSRFMVIAGDHDRARYEDTEQRRNVSSISVHEAYRRAFLGNDIAVLRLEEDIKYTREVKPICLPWYDDTSGTLCITTGWGITHEGNHSGSMVLNEVRVRIMDRAFCKRTDVYGNAFKKTMVCAGYRDGGRDTCKADSGGPLMCRENGVYYLYGITSWGEGCGRPMKPGVYTRVSQFVGWIYCKTYDPLNIPLPLQQLLQQLRGVDTLDCDCLQHLQMDEDRAVSCGEYLSRHNITEVEVDTLSCNIKTKCPEGCTCIDIPTYGLLTVDCRNYAGTKLPLHLPSPRRNTLDFRYILDFAHGSLTALEERDYMTHVWTASFKHNRVNVVHSGFLRSALRPAGCLRSLNLSYNSISNIKHEDGYFPTPDTKDEVMWKVDLSHNEIRYLHQISDGFNITEGELVHLLVTGKLDLGNNPLVCDCIDYSMLRDLKLAENTTSLTCGAPGNVKGSHITELKPDRFICSIEADCPSRCICTYIPSQQILKVDCRNYPGKTLPQKMPSPQRKTSPFKYTLDFEGGSLISLENWPYIKNVAIATFSANYIEEIPAGFFDEFNQFSMLKLDSNNIKMLPLIIEKWPEHMYLGRNDWRCSCENEPTIQRIEDNKDRVVDYPNVLCSAPDTFKNKDFEYVKYILCSDPKESDADGFKVPFIVLGALVIFVLLVIGVLYVRRVWVYKMFKWHPFDRDGADGAMKEFDVFLSYCDSDSPYIENDILPKLRELGFKLCHHREHFLAGDSIIENIHKAIMKSKRTLIFFSQAYMASGLCMHEFHTVLTLQVIERHKRLVTIKARDIEIQTLEIGIQSFFQHYTYVDQDSPTFWDNLSYILPSDKITTQGRANAAQNGNGNDIEMVAL